MESPTYSGNGGSPRSAEVNAGRLWAGGAATAAVAALVAAVGMLIARGIFDIPVLAPDDAGTLAPASTVRLALFAAAAALLATALMHVLLLSTPSPFQFFGWIVGLATVAAALLPFLTDAPTAEKVATMLINLTIGLAIGSLISSVAASSVRQRTTRRPGYAGGPPPA